MSILCNICHERVYINVDTNKYNILCQTCIKVSKLCSKTKSQRLFLLNDNSYHSIKPVYIKNLSQSFYLYEEVEKLAIEKHGSIENLENIIKDKHEKKRRRQNIKNDIIKEREIELKQTFLNHKLEFKNHGDCYSYIHYGTPSIEEVLRSEYNKNNEKFNRKRKIAKKLSDCEIPFEETTKACYEYINGIGCKSLSETIREIEIQYFIKHEEEFEKLYNNTLNKKKKTFLRPSIKVNFE